jgi:hypothetical protein
MLPYLERVSLIVQVDLANWPPLSLASGSATAMNQCQTSMLSKKCRTSIVSTPYQTHRMTRINHDVAKRTVVTFYKEYEKKNM